MLKNNWRQHEHDETTFQSVCDKTRRRSCGLWPSEMGLVATSFYTLSKHISIFRRFHLNYKAQKEKRPLLSQDRFLAKIAIVFSARRIPAVFLINSAPRSMRRQNASMPLTSTLDYIVMQK